MKRARFSTVQPVNCLVQAMKMLCLTVFLAGFFPAWASAHVAPLAEQHYATSAVLDIGVAALDDAGDDCDQMPGAPHGSCCKASPTCCGALSAILPTACAPVFIASRSAGTRAADHSGVVSAPSDPPPRSILG